MKAAKHEFAILPWEYRGASFDPAPQAITSLDVGGRKREFLLKMREGLIYFKEPKRAPVFAVLNQFDKEVRGDELVRAWQREVERENFGRVGVTHHRLSWSFADTVVVSIHRPDYSGWISDAFHVDWQQTPAHRDSSRFDIWTGSLVSAKSRAVRRASASLFDRVMPLAERTTSHSRWFRGSEDELRRIFSTVMLLYFRRQGGLSAEKGTWYFAASNIATSGGFSYYYSAFAGPTFQASLALKPLIRLLEEQFGWTAMRWEHQRYEGSPPDPDVKDPAPAMAERWGEHWRGCYSIDIPRIEMTVPLLASISHHERLELSLELRDWLKGKVKPGQMDEWLAQILD